MKDLRTRIGDYFFGKPVNGYNRDKWIQCELNALPDGTKILDAGAGECKWKKSCGRFEYVSQDICQYEGEGNGKGIQTGNWDTNQIDIVSDITNIPVENEKFDAILCTEVLEHLPHPELAIKELSRITRTGGVILLTAPFNSLTHFAPYHYCTGFNIYWYKKCLQEYGWEIIEMKNNGDYFSYFNQELRHLDSIVRKYTNRKGVLIKIQAFLLGNSLKKIIELPNNSFELQCFGYHIKAKKI